MPETRFTSLPALSIDPRVGISRSESEPMINFLFLPIVKNDAEIRTSFGVFRYVA